MAKKKAKKPCNCDGKCCGNCSAPIWIDGSNISQETREWATNLLKQGITVYWREGRPPGGGCIPGQPGCQQ